MVETRNENFSFLSNSLLVNALWLPFLHYLQIESFCYSTGVQRPVSLCCIVYLNNERLFLTEKIKTLKAIKTEQ